MTTITCRTCLTQHSKTTSVFAVGMICGQKLSLQKVLAKCADLQISHDDGLPQQICTICVRQAEKAYLFRNMCEKSQSTLIEQTKQNPLLEVEQVIKYEIAENSDQTDNDEANSAYNDEFENSDSQEIVQYNELTNFNIPNKEIYTSKNDEHLEEKPIENSKITDDLVRKHTIYRCRLCNSSYETKSLLESHKLYVHETQSPRMQQPEEVPTQQPENSSSGQKMSKCPICKKGYYSSTHMNLHLTGKRYHCDMCGKDFSQYRTFTSHIYSHTGERPFLCSECGKTFKQNVDLRSHMNIHLNLFPYTCTTCGKEFRNHSTFIGHKRIHTGEKPFPCPFCDKRFRTSKGLLDHKRTHTGEKPFACTICGKSFAKSYARTVHFRTHTGIKPHVCTICDRTFSQAHCLRSHMKSYHQNDEDMLQPDTILEICANSVDEN